jgi:hypothetical protein
MAFGLTDNFFTVTFPVWTHSLQAKQKTTRSVQTVTASLTSVDRRIPQSVTWLFTGWTRVRIQTGMGFYSSTVDLYRHWRTPIVDKMSTCNFHMSVQHTCCVCNWDCYKYCLRTLFMYPLIGRYNFIATCFRSVEPSSGNIHTALRKILYL